MSGLILKWLRLIEELTSYLLYNVMFFFIMVKFIN